MNSKFLVETRISIIAAIGERRELGKNNKLLWHIPEDLKRFKKLTLNHPIIMGRKTFESIGRVLPGRANIIITRDPSYLVKGAVVVHSLEEAIEESIKYYVSSSKYKDKSKKIQNTKYPSASPSAAGRASFLIHNSDKDEIFVIGGGQIYKEALPLADRLYLTIVKGIFDADTFFPEYKEFTKIVSEEHRESEGYIYTFLVLER